MMGSNGMTYQPAGDQPLIPPDIDQVRIAFDWTLRLDRTAAYDSFYLALAESLRCDLWTAARHLRNAVEQSWVRWAGEQ
jgi:predicted nucleic acid-binding protein